MDEASISLDWTEWLPLAVLAALTFVAGITSVVVGLTTKEVRRKRWYWAGAVALAASSILSFAMSIRSERAAKRDSAALIEARDTGNRNRELLEEVRRTQGDDTLLQEFFEMAHRRNYASSEKEAHTFVEELFRILPSEVERARDVRRRSEDLETQYLIKWQPLYDLVLTLFDTRAKGLAAKGLGRDLKIQAIPLLAEAGKWSGSTGQIRRLGVGVGVLTILLRQGRVRSGELDQVPRLHVLWHYGSSREQLASIGFRLQDDGLGIAYLSTVERLGLGESKAVSTMDRPDKDAVFTEKITTAMNAAFRIAVVDAEAGKATE